MDNDLRARLERAVEFPAECGQECIAELEALQRLHPEELEVALTLTYVLYRSDRFSDAVRQAEGILDHDPDNARAHLLMAACLERSSRLEEALQACERSLRRDADSALTHGLMGQILQRMGCKAEALTRYEEADRLHPNDPSIMAPLAELYLHKGQGGRLFDGSPCTGPDPTGLRLAQETAARLAAIPPDTPGVSYTLGDPYREFFHLMGWRTLALAELNLARYAAALDATARGLACYPWDSGLHFTRAACFGSTGRWAAALRSLAQAMLYHFPTMWMLRRGSVR